MDETMIAFRAVHPDFRSSRGFVWPFPGRIARASGPFSDHKGGCPQSEGDGICLGTTWAGVASGGIPAITVLVCEYKTKHLLGQEDGKVRVKEAKVLRVIDFPAILRGDVARDDNLEYNNLQGANLRNANLRGADLRKANLWYANFWNADLWNANLWFADLRKANLWNANLRKANLWNANLRGADLRKADLQGADLRYADLRGADLRNADLRDAIVSTTTTLSAGWVIQGDRIVKVASTP